MTVVEPCVYFLLDDEGRILYIGSTGNFERRIKEHARTQHWWHLVRDARCFAARTRAEAYEVEEWAIRKYFPPLNERSIPDASVAPLLTVDEMACAYERELFLAEANRQQAEKWRERVLHDHGVDLAQQAVAS